MLSCSQSFVGKTDRGQLERLHTLRMNRSCDVPPIWERPCGSDGQDSNLWNGAAVASSSETALWEVAAERGRGRTDHLPDTRKIAAPNRAIMG
jgi:hypothetical protein